MWFIDARQILHGEEVTNDRKAYLTAMKRLAKNLERNSMFRDYALDESDIKDPEKKADFARRHGYNSGMGYALSILVQLFPTDRGGQ